MNTLDPYAISADVYDLTSGLEHQQMIFGLFDRIAKRRSPGR